VHVTFFHAVGLGTFLEPSKNVLGTRTSSKVHNLFKSPQPLQNSTTPLKFHNPFELKNLLALLSSFIHPHNSNVLSSY
jgi:hypothetical protein